MSRVIDHLRALVGADTTNPPRRIDAAHVALRHCLDALSACGFKCNVTELGDGCVTLLAKRGAPTTLVNCHLDTVPVCPGWTSDPFDLHIDGGNAIGLGACDVKGSAAALLAAVERTDGDAMILFTTDEEAGSSRCVRTFLESAPHEIEGVIVCEPTACAAVSAHRGLFTADVEFAGRASHASDAAVSNAIHDAVRWSAAALDWSDAQPEGARLAIGTIQGGAKSNVAASSASLRVAVRPAVGACIPDMKRELQSLPGAATARWVDRFQGPTLEAHASAASLGARLGAPASPAVDFWTEASLFAEAGLPAVVFGPGSIRQAHTADEFVPLDELERAASHLARLFQVEPVAA